MGCPALGPNYDGVSSFAPGGASRIPDGTDTDTAGDWVRNDFDLFGIPGFAGTPALGEAVNTPNATNESISVLTDPVGVCGDASTLIHDIQGSGLASSDVGSIREVEAVVVATFLGSDRLAVTFYRKKMATLMLIRSHLKVCVSLTMRICLMSVMWCAFGDQLSNIQLDGIE